MFRKRLFQRIPVRFRKGDSIDMRYQVKLDLFEGPFELLIYLIEHARMSVYDIRIAEITTQYLDYVSRLSAIDPQLAQEFMVLAAELIEIKARMLLPRPAEPEEGEEEEDPRTQLVQRILEYRRFKAMAAFFEEQQEIASLMYTKPQEDLSPWTGEPDILLTATEDELAEAFRAFLSKKQRLEEVRRTYQLVERERRSMESRMEEISKLFESKETLMFSEIIRKDPSVFNRVLSFMSLLEMIKEGLVSAQQQVRYGDIQFTRTGKPSRSADDQGYEGYTEQIELTDKEN